MKLTISGFSSALFSTFYYVDEYRLLFDVGDGISALLNQKARKVKNVFVSHADRDHLGGMLQFNQLNARAGGYPVIHYPKDCGSFPALQAFTSTFDPHVTHVQWKGIEDGERLPLSKTSHVRAIRNEHIIAPIGTHKSLSYHLVQTKKKLKPQYTSLPGKEIGRLMKERGEEALTDVHEEIILSYSGDTPITLDGRWDKSKVLIHEATFLNRHDINNFELKGAKHTILDELMPTISDCNFEALILGHFSTRYSAFDIDNAIRKLCKEHAVKYPVYRILPGRFTKNILAHEPVNA